MAEDTSTNTDGADDAENGDGSSDSTDTSTQQLGAGGEAALKAERERARRSDRELKAALARLKSFEDRDKTEAQKLEERATTAEKAAAEAAAQLTRYQVAAEKGLPVELAGRLQGATAKELAADADKLIALLGQARGGPPAFNGGPRKTAEGKTDINAMIRAAAGFGS